MQEALSGPTNGSGVQLTPVASASTSTSTNVPGPVQTPTITPAQESALKEASDASYLAQLVADGNEDAALIGTAVTSYKAHGIIGLVPLISRARKDAEATVADGEAVIATVKAGYKTSEFWLAALAVACPAVGAMAGHPMPAGISVTGASLAGLYMTLRSLVKAKAS